MTHTKDEALKLALDALESDSISGEKYEAAITAIKQALAAPIVQEPVGYITQARCFVHLHECTDDEAKLYGWKAISITPPAAAPMQSVENKENT
jgi:hypothetical protein